MAHHLVLLATALVNRIGGRALPGLSTGPFVALVLFVASLPGARPARIAPALDRALGFKDRLASFLDLAGRADVDERYRRAQAAETAAALARVSPRRAVVIRRWLWAAPPLFAWLLYASYFSFFLPQGPRWVRQLTMTVTGGPGGPAGEEQTGGVKIVSVAPAPTGGTGPTGRGERTAGHGEQAARQQPPQPERPPGAASPEAAAGTSAEPATPSGGGAEGAASGAAANFPRPARLFSSPVGAALTPVAAAPASAPAGGPRATSEAPRGRVAFNLVPGRGAGTGPVGPGSGQGTGTDGTLRVVVDFAALAPEVRESVRRYFDEISTLFTGGSLGTR